MRRANVKDDEGKITTPFDIALHMVDKLFEKRAPSPLSKVLDAGCGSGVFIEAMLSWCEQRGIEPPKIIGVEIDPCLVDRARDKFYVMGKIEIVQGDFLIMDEQELGGKFDYVISNPPYISYEKMDISKRKLYRRIFKVATGRFDTYMLFFEKALEMLRPGGRLAFITPEKYLYVISARNLRKLLTQYHVEEIELMRENIFKGVLAYPAITIVNKLPPAKTCIIFRNGRAIELNLPRDGSSWLAKAQIHDLKNTAMPQELRYKLEDIAVRISAGVATGRDGIFIIPKRRLPKGLEAYAYPTISGSELAMFKPGEAIDYDRLPHVILVPYSRDGELLGEDEAKPLIAYLSRWRSELESRYVVRTGKKRWYAFHEDPPLKDILRPKILWRDIAREPEFYIDAEGRIIPRHTVYYLVPKNPAIISKLIKYLNSDGVKRWLKAYCQRAANGYLRLQSHVLKALYIPDELSLDENSIVEPGGLDRWIRAVKMS